MHYINLNEAKKLLLERINLKNQVCSFWESLGIQIPFCFDHPTAVVGKPAAFRIESAVCMHMAEAAELGICWLTYDEDKYTDRSTIKRSLVHPYFTNKLNSAGGFIATRVKKVNELRAIQRLPLSKLVSDNGENILEFHRDRLLRANPGVHISDMSTWSNQVGGEASDYYEAYLSLFVAHGILFEDYHGGESGAGLSSFTKTIFEPAFERVTQRFGAKPIVVKLPWKPHYAYYPDGELYTGWREMVISAI